MSGKLDFVCACVCVVVHVCVKVLQASIMYVDNAATSLYQQLTGIPTHTKEDRMRRERKCMRLQRTER